MKRVCLLLVVIQIAGLVPMAMAKTHKDSYPVSCDVLWKAVKDAVRNSGKYGIVGIDNDEMSISFIIGGTMGGKRINSVVLNRASESVCEMQTQTAYSGLIHNDAGDLKDRVEKSLAKQPAEKAALKEPQPVRRGDGNVAPVAGEPPAQTANLKNGQTVEEVEKLVGKPQDTVTLKDSIVYIYPTVKLFFEKGQVVDIQHRDGIQK
jgi:hypothetical protein